MLYLLQFRPPQVRICFGCGQSLKPGGQIGRPPCDLVVVSHSNRLYPDKQTGTFKDRPGNVYFHANTGCLKRQLAYFIAALVQIPQQRRNMLTPGHILHLREFALFV